jgi:hypothetical protein
MTLSLANIPGFNDLSDTPLAAEKNVIGVHLGGISGNAAFGVVRLEVFTGLYHDGDTVILPTSDIDGYNYQRSELMYLWVPINTGNPSTQWATDGPPWTMWYGAWSVDQTTGAVACAVGYRGNNDHKDRQANTKDSTLQIFTIAQRNLTTLTLAAAASYVDHPDSAFYTDRALNTSLVQEMNHAAKFGVVNTEVIYMGVFKHGDTVPTPASPADGHAYSYAEVKFQTSPRWTADDDGGSPGTMKIPDLGKGQLSDWASSVSSLGLVSISVVYELTTQTTFHTGRVAVFAFCSRAVSAFGAVNPAFSEIDSSTWLPGKTLRASTMKALQQNIRAAVVVPEFFGPTSYSDGGTVALPTSPIDGYAYSRGELTYIWDWANTGPDSFATDRLVLASANIDSLGGVHINQYRFVSGGTNWNLEHNGSLRVYVFAKRNIVAGVPTVVAAQPVVGTIADDSSGLITVDGV